jgi:hypothetical protein
MSSTHTISENVLVNIRELLKAGEHEKALQVIHRTGSQAPEMKNAQGVCMLRMGRIEGAIDVLRELVFQKQLCIPLNTPPLFQANYATALLLKHYNQMAIEIIKSLPDSAHPYVSQLKQAIGQWQQALPLHQWFRCLVRVYPPTPVVLNFPPGQV